MRTPRKRYTKEFKLEAIRLAESSGRLFCGAASVAGWAGGGPGSSAIQ